jgi:hypothetical protein
MKHLAVELLDRAGVNASINEVSFFLDDLARHTMDQVPWVKFNYKPCVQFAMAYGPQSIFLKYYVEEQYIAAANGAVNGAVYEDSCVEFFISFENEQPYYNFEFNCIGTARVGYGENKSQRELLPEGLISGIKYQALINNQKPGGDIHWELTVAIPLDVFCHHSLKEIKGKNCRANFYKCGDLLPTPHFICWSAINAAEPNFHLPDFFGTLKFE